jgi:hypothetical protein
MILRLILLALLLLSCAESSGNDSVLTPSGFSGLSGNGSVHLSWNASSNADVVGAEIHISTDDLNFSLKQAITGKPSGFTVSDLTNGTQYYFKIRFTTTSGASAFSKSIQITPAQRFHEGVNVATWNVENFYNPTRDPNNDVQQKERVKNLFHSFEFDLVGFQEISDEAQFLDIMSDLPHHSAKISSSTYSPRQSIALAYNDTLFEFISSSSILTSNYTAGRPPLQVKLKHIPSNTTFYVIVIHNKAGAGSSDHSSRVDISNALRSHIVVNHPNDFVMVLGDYNDKLVSSIATGKTSPYTNFTSDTANFKTPTKFLNETAQTEHSLPGFSNTIDHIMVTNEFSTSMIKSGSVNVMENEVLNIYSDYFSTVSDHCPVMLTVLF